MDQALKAIALSNLTAQLSRCFGVGDSEDLKLASASRDPKVKQGLTILELKEEVEKETPTGEEFLLALAVDPNKSEAENRKILGKFIGHRR